MSVYYDASVTPERSFGSPSAVSPSSITFMRRTAAFFLLIASTALPASAQSPLAGPSAPITDAPSLVAAMHGRYAATWYRTLSFTQQTGLRAPDGTESVETWREWAALPGQLRIEMEDPLAGLDVLFARDSTFAIRDGALARARAGRNPLVVLGFDIYAQPPSVTLAALAADGVDVTVFREDVWDGRAAFVVGRPAGGEVWIERDRLLFVRLVSEGRGGETEEVRFLGYEPLGGGWIAPRVEAWSGGHITQWETYADIVANPPLDPVLFDPRRWADGVAATRAMRK